MRGDMLRKLEAESVKLKDELRELLDGIQTGDMKKLISLFLLQNQNLILFCILVLHAI